MNFKYSWDSKSENVSYSNGVTQSRSAIYHSSIKINWFDGADAKSTTS